MWEGEVLVGTVCVWSLWVELLDCFVLFIICIKEKSIQSVCGYC